MNFTLEQGKKLVKLARNSVEFYFLKKEISSKEFPEKRGVFVTLQTYPYNQLRGCIGFPEPIFPLGEAIIKAARAAAFSDPRFLPLKEEELNSIIFEVSVLTLPDLIKVKKSEEYFKKIEIGKDGLSVECEGIKALLLPQVFQRGKTTVEQALEMLMQKAGLVMETWKEKNCKIYKFQAQIFSEEKPNGKIVEKNAT